MKLNEEKFSAYCDKFPLWLFDDDPQKRRDYCLLPFMIVQGAIKQMDDLYMSVFEEKSDS